MIFNKLLEDCEASTSGIVERPWGKFIVLDTIIDLDNVVHRQKLLMIKPNTSLQLHKHLKYNELWIGENEFDYELENEKAEIIKSTALPYSRIFIPLNKKHKIINNSNEELKIFELQTGVITDDDNIKFD